ncbi:unnamed protein product, partial [Linum tenue]
LLRNLNHSLILFSFQSFANSPRQAPRRQLTRERIVGVCDSYLLK